jgi:hypothetical protein
LRDFEASGRKHTGTYRPKQWPYSINISNLVIVPKEIAEPVEVKLTCDSKPVNKAIHRTRYPGKTIDDLVCLVYNGAEYFSNIDIRKAFHQVMIDEKSRNNTTITMHLGLFRYLRLRMGIKNAQEEFTVALRVALLGLAGQIKMTDDVLVFGRTFDEQYWNLMAVLKRLEDTGIKLIVETDSRDKRMAMGTKGANCV